MATELAKAYVQIIPSARGIQGSITQALGGEAASAGTHAGQTFGSNLVGKVLGVVSAAAIGKAIAATITEGAALEQSIGGIETLFKGSFDQVKAYADNAYATTGLSANAYMESVTGFSARLLQGLGGDTEAAAELANTAMEDMADNANKMGTAMSSIQDTYQSLARGNYEMLDNLKLGYGGTQAEMARLINESGVLGDTMVATADNVNSIGFDKVIQAIHAVQQNMGITGTTADEAARTLTGSLNAMKAAGQNVLGNLTLGQDITPSLQALAQTTTTFLVGNLLPAVFNILKALPGGVVTLVQELGAQLAARLPAFLTQVQAALASGGPQLLQGGLAMAQQLGQGLAQGIPQLLAQALPMLLQFTGSLRANFGQLVDAGIGLVLNLAQGLIAALPTLIEYVPEIVTNIAGLINDNAPKLLAAAGQLILMLGQGLIQSLPVIVANMGSILQAVADVITAVNWLGLGAKVLTLVGDGLKSMAGGITAAMQGSFASAVEYLKSLPAQALSWGRDMISGFIKGITSRVAGVAGAVKNVASAAASYLHFSRPDTGPLRDYETWMPDMMSGLAKGITDNIYRVTAAMRTLGATTAGVLQQDLAGILGQGQRRMGAAHPATAATIQQFNTFNTHDSLSEAELTREAESMAKRLQWAIP